MFEKIMELVAEYPVIILHRHSEPDGDAIGSQTGLKMIIRDNFPEKKVYSVGDCAARYAFMDESETDVIPDAAYDGALAIVLDSAAKSLVSDGRFACAAKTARIDHHIYCDNFTDVEVIDTSFESCCGMIAELALENGLFVSAKAAAALFTGMVTDSGRFRFDSTTARTFALASFLMNCGVDPAPIYKQLYSSDLSKVKVRTSFVQRIRIFEDSCVAYVYTDKAEVDALAAQGFDLFSISRGMVNVMSDIKGVDIWVNFTEDGEKVLCELRSSIYNINPVAVKYGGGGHQKACGADVRDRAEAMEMLRDLADLATESGRGAKNGGA